MCGIFKINNKDTEQDNWRLMSLLLLWADFKHCPGISIDEFEHVNAGWGISRSSSYTNVPQKSCSRSSRSQALFKNSVLKNFVNFTRKHLRWNLFLMKLKACNFIKKRLRRRCFPVKYAKFLRTPFFLQNTSGCCFCCSQALENFSVKKRLGFHTSKNVGRLLSWVIPHDFRTFFFK